MRSHVFCLQQEASLLLHHHVKQPPAAAGSWSQTQPWTEPSGRSPPRLTGRLQLLVLRLVSRWRPEAPEQLRAGTGGPGAAGGAAGGRPDGGVPATCPQTAEGTQRLRPSLSPRRLCVLVFLPSQLLAASSWKPRPQGPAETLQPDAPLSARPGGTQSPSAKPEPWGGPPVTQLCSGPPVWTRVQGAKSGWTGCWSRFSSGREEKNPDPRSA